MNTRFYSILLIALTLTQASAAANTNDGYRLELLPENPRYLQYKGLPCVLFWGTHHWGWRGYPDAGQIEHTGRYANFITLQASKYRYSDYPTLWQRAHDDDYWRKLRQSVEAANECDVIVHLYFYDGNYSPEQGKYHAPTRFFDYAALDEDLAEFSLPGRTRRDIHQALINKAVEHLWDCPNIVFDPVFEMVNTYRWGVDADEFQRWWVGRFKQAGNSRNPEVSHLFGTMWGGNGNYREGKQSHPMGNQRQSHPRDRAMDLLIGEHTQDGFFVDPEDNSETVYRWQVPMIRMGLHSPEWNRDRIHRIGGPAQKLMIEQILYGIHTAEPYNFDGHQWTTELTDPELRRWMLQTRWYIENIRTWRNEPARYGGDEIAETRLPRYAESQRPILLNPPGFEMGARRSDRAVRFACVYRDSDGDAPAQAEVWVDLNIDGRFDPDPDHGERLTMKSGDTMDYRDGVLFEAAISMRESGPLRYVFRFADRHWLPPVPDRGLAPRGSYSHLTVCLD